MSRSISTVFNNASDSDSDSDSEFKNEIPPEGVNPEFANDVLHIKHVLYEDDIYSPQLDTPNAQDNTLLSKYQNHIKVCYILSKDAQKGLNTKNNADNINSQLAPFSDNSKSLIIKLIDWIADFFMKNIPSDTLIYTRYLENQFNVYPFTMKLYIE